VVRRAWGFAQPFRRSIAGFLVAIVLSALVALLPPLIFRRIIDVAIPADDRRQVWVLGGLTVVVALIDAGLAILQRWYSARIGEGLIFDEGMATRRDDETIWLGSVEATVCTAWPSSGKL
jgi:ATP-binding cassette subfamily B protein